jgi:glutathione peroxidase
MRFPLASPQRHAYLLGSLPGLVPKEIAMRGWLVAGLFVVGCALVAQEKGANALNFKMKTLDGKEVDLSKYQGKVVLLVNVASECGYTPQYKGLQALHEKFAAKGLAVVGVPSNDFGKQEPGSSAQIADFCKKNYGVQFDMLEKVAIKGKDAAPLYQFLTSKEKNPKFGGEVKWNFTKFLIGKNGQIVARFEPGVKPEDKQVIDAIEAELKK